MLSFEIVGMGDNDPEIGSAYWRAELRTENQWYMDSLYVSVGIFQDAGEKITLGLTFFRSSRALQ